MNIVKFLRIPLFYRTPPVAASDFCNNNHDLFVAQKTILTEQKMKFSIKDFFSKYDQIRSLLKILRRLLIIFFLILKTFYFKMF